MASKEQLQKILVLADELAASYQDLQDDLGELEQELSNAESDSKSDEPLEQVEGCADNAQFHLKAVQDKAEALRDYIRGIL